MKPSRFILKCILSGNFKQCKVIPDKIFKQWKNFNGIDNSGSDSSVVDVLKQL